MNTEPGNFEESTPTIGPFRRWVTGLMFRPTLLWNRLLYDPKKRRWWDWIDESVLLGALPQEPEIPKLKEEGIQALINTCVEYPGAVDALQEAGIEQLHVPTVDFTPPTLDDIETSVQFIHEKSGEGKKVYVHCKAGRGRSATIVICWLIHNKGMNPEAAEELVREKRPHIMKNLYKRVVVQQFYEKWKLKNEESKS